MRMGNFHTLRAYCSAKEFKGYISSSRLGLCCCIGQPLWCELQTLALGKDVSFESFDQTWQLVREMD